MGVHGLWEIVSPTARPVRVEGLRNKRLAVDASIWIYQFLKAVRDKEGNQLKNSHIVGFLRRICKLLYFGIKPVFVFDGGVPALKKDTIRKRKEKREGNKESIEQTAQKILARQLQLFADTGDIPTRPNAANTTATRREIPTDELYFDAYYDDQVEGDSTSQSQKVTENSPKKQSENESKMFRGQDDYDLPNNGPIKVSNDDNRVMAGYEYDRLTKDIYDDLEGIDLDSIDPQSKEFEKLPLSTQYIALSHLRLRSRLRMGYTKEQLQTLFPDPMEFSKFQIQMVQKRNFFTQKVMNVTGMDGNSDDDVVSRRIASDKNRAYDLQRTGDGYALSISKESLQGATAERPIFLGDVNDIAVSKGYDPVEIEDSDDDYDDVDWGDVEIVDEKQVISTDRDHDNTNGDVENPLFIKDSDIEGGEESDDDSDEGIEMEDVTLATGEQEKNEEDDEIMKKIKYLYEYSDKHNKKSNSANSPIEVASDDANDNYDIDDYQEIQIKQIEDDELRQAIERSKREYLGILDDEKNGSTLKPSLVNEEPIILSTSTLAKTLGIKNFSLKNNILFGGQIDKPQKKPEAVPEKSENEKKKPLPLPDWFTRATEFSEKPKVDNENPKAINLTEDEKAGLISYGDVDNYFSSEDEQDFIEITGSNVRANNDKVGMSDNNPVTIDLDDDDTNINTNNSNVEMNESQKPDMEDLTNINKNNKTKFGNFEKSRVHFEDSIKGNGNFNEQLFEKNVQNKESSQQTNTEPLFIQEENDTKLFDDNLRIEAPIIEEETESNKLIPGTNKKITDFLKTQDKTPTNKKDEEEEDDEFSDEEEVNLLLNMEEENIASDRFFNKIKGNSLLADDKSDLWTFTDEAALQERLKKQKRDSEEVSTKMIQDVQELLARFGIPYITAPMEAEAQCAELEIIGLVDGIITDDSDCFLFGGDKIYKNLFNEKNFVELYQDDDILEEMGLTRETMIELAILLGSDYTEGLKGIGKVMAMEILGEFTNLENFKKWWVDYQNGKIEESKDTPLRKKLRKSLGKSLFLGNDFPNKLIYEAYLHPDVDHDKSEFKWGYPDIEKLRTFLMYYVGWNKEKIDEILVPVMNSLSKPQATIEEFFPRESIQRRRQLDMSKRLKDATEKLKKSRHNDLVDRSNKRQKV